MGFEERMGDTLSTERKKEGRREEHALVHGGKRNPKGERMKMNRNKRMEREGKKQRRNWE
jgi:hypothetical protein